MDIFQQKGVPKELTRLPLVESAFNLSARSKVGASGIWQFMRSTGKLFLRIDKSVDERNDPITAAWAASELLRRNFERLKSWPLAITAYNHGPEGMARAVETLGTRDLAQIIKRYKGRTFGFASSNFYCEFLAILELERDYRRHFGKLLVDAPISFEEFLVGDNVKFEDLADACRMSEEQLASWNPALTDWVVSGKGHVPQGYRLKVPPGKMESCRSGMRNARKVSLLPNLPMHMTPVGFVRRNPLRDEQNFVPNESLHTLQNQGTQASRRLCTLSRARDFDISRSTLALEDPTGVMRICRFPKRSGFRKARLASNSRRLRRRPM